MMWVVVESRAAIKQLDRCPKHILKEYEAWRRVIELSGPTAIRVIPGYHDHPLKGQWQGARSSWLNSQWRVIYAVFENLVQIKILEVTPHDYRKKG